MEIKKKSGTSKKTFVGGNGKRWGTKEEKMCRKGNKKDVGQR